MKKLSLLVLITLGLYLDSCKDKQNELQIAKQPDPGYVVNKFDIKVFESDKTNAFAIAKDSIANMFMIFSRSDKSKNSPNLTKITYINNSDLFLSVELSESTKMPISYTLKSAKYNYTYQAKILDINLNLNKLKYEIYDLSNNNKIVSPQEVDLSSENVQNLLYVKSILNQNSYNGRTQAVGCLQMEKAITVAKGVFCLGSIIISVVTWETFLLSPALAEVRSFLTLKNCSDFLERTDGWDKMECSDFTKDYAPAVDCIIEVLGWEFTKNKPVPACMNNDLLHPDKNNFPSHSPAHSTGDPHLMTLDGTSFDFQSHGEYISTLSTIDNFEVQVRQEDIYKTGSITMNTGIAVQTGTDVICVTVKPYKLFINKQLQDLTNLTTLSLKDGASVTKIRQNNHDALNITNKNGDIINVVFQSTDYLDYFIYLADNRKSKVKGLMGNFDGDKTNDIQTRAGENILVNGSLAFDKLYTTYADSWRITQANSLFYYDAGKSTDTYTQKDFPRTIQTLTAAQKASAESVCRAAGITSEPFLSNCIFDVAITNNTALANSAFLAQKNASNASSSPVTITPPSNQATIINFNDIKQIELKGNAKVVNGCIRLTEANYNVVGAAYYKSTLSGDFESEFTFKISELANGGADGFTFLISKNIPELNIGEGLGYQGTKASLAVEFDTWQNTNLGDPNDNHISIHTNGQDANSADEKYSIGINDKIINLSDGTTHTVKIVYQNKVMEVFLDGKSAVKASIDLNSKLGLTGSFYIGFTAATGGSTEIHDICSWSFKNL